MASKQLGKLRQWAGEVISSRDKSTVTDEFRELEKDIELRRDGAQRLLLASTSYQYALSKKKKTDAFEDAEKLLPVDSLGVIMISHGEEYGDDSAYGMSLVKLGQAHCKVATLQEAYALTFKDTFLASIEKFTDEIREYEQQRKKLESRRLSYDASVAKFEKLKGGKKEKERREAEDEMERAKQRFEETSDDVLAHMHAIQENETVQLRDLTSLLNLEIKFVQQYLNVLKGVKSDWHDEPDSMPVQPPREAVPTHIFSRSLQEVGSVRSRRSSRSDLRGVSDSSDDERISRSVPTLRASTHGRSGSSVSRPSSRPSSRASRKRSDSTGTTGDKDEKSRRMSVAGWASNAVGSVTGRGKKGKDKFATLSDDFGQGGEDTGDDDGNPPLKKSSSFHSLSMKLAKDRSKESSRSGSPKLPARILKPPSLQKKIVRALHDFSGSSDELSFRAGDEIVVVSEVLDGWWMGELGGRKGLFPTTYVEVLATKPSLPKPSASTRGRDMESSPSSENSTGRQRWIDGDEYLTSDQDDDHSLGAQPLVTPTHGPFYAGPSDVASVTSSLTEDEDEKRLMPRAAMSGNSYSGDNYLQSYPSKSSPQLLDRGTLSTMSTSPYPARRSTTTDLTSSASLPGKKAPPPPPPRRVVNVPAVSPPIPERRPKSSRTRSSSSSMAFARPPPSSVSSRGYDTSPFESVTELSTTKGGCGDFKQSPFQPKGMCSNCFSLHSS